MYRPKLPLEHIFIFERDFPRIICHHQEIGWIEALADRERHKQRRALGTSAFARAKRRQFPRLRSLAFPCGEMEFEPQFQGWADADVPKYAPDGHRAAGLMIWRGRRGLYQRASSVAGINTAIRGQHADRLETVAVLAFVILANLPTLLDDAERGYCQSDRADSRQQNPDISPFVDEVENGLKGLHGFSVPRQVGARRQPRPHAPAPRPTSTWAGAGRGWRLGCGTREYWQRYGQALDWQVR